MPDASVQPAARRDRRGRQNPEFGMIEFDIPPWMYRDRASEDSFHLSARTNGRQRNVIFVARASGTRAVAVSRGFAMKLKALLARIVGVALCGVTALTFNTVSAEAASGLQFQKVYYNSPGSDDGSNASLNAEWVQIKNVTSTTKSLTGWTVRDLAGHVYTFPTTKVAAGDVVRLHTGKGTIRPATGTGVRSGTCGITLVTRPFFAAPTAAWPIPAPGLRQGRATRSADSRL